MAALNNRDWLPGMKVAIGQQSALEGCRGKLKLKLIEPLHRATTVLNSWVIRPALKHGGRFLECTRDSPLPLQALPRLPSWNASVNDYWFLAAASPPGPRQLPLIELITAEYHAQIWPGSSGVAVQGQTPHFQNMLSFITFYYIGFNQLLSFIKLWVKRKILRNIE